MKKIECLIAVTAKSVALDELADHIVDSYPMQQWLWDHANSDEVHGHWIFYANEANEVKAFFEGEGRKHGFRVDTWRVSEVEMRQEQEIRQRLR
jgi:hypothetical protein